jgi:hypothetical protein
VAAVSGTARPGHINDARRTCSRRAEVGYDDVVKWIVLVASIAASGCVERALGLGDDGGGGGSGGGADLAARDLAMASMVGLQCGAAWCDTSTGNVCCETTPTICGPGPCGRGVQTDSCDGPEDCPGQACCLLVSPVFGAACQPTCSAAGNQRYRICHTHDDCAPNQACCPLEVSGGLRGCIDGGPLPSCT